MIVKLKYGIELQKDIAKEFEVSEAEISQHKRKANQIVLKHHEKNMYQPSLSSYFS